MDLYNEEIALRKEISDLERELRRKSYISGGLMALILNTGRKRLIARAKKVLVEADEASKSAC